MTDARIPSGRPCSTDAPSVRSPEMVCSRGPLRGKGLPDVPTGVSTRRGARIRRESRSSMTVEALCRRREHRCVRHPRHCGVSLVPGISMSCAN